MVNMDLARGKIAGVMRCKGVVCGKHMICKGRAEENNIHCGWK